MNSPLLFLLPVPNLSAQGATPETPPALRRIHRRSPLRVRWKHHTLDSRAQAPHRISSRTSDPPDYRFHTSRSASNHYEAERMAPLESHSVTGGDGASPASRDRGAKRVRLGDCIRGNFIARARLLQLRSLP